MGALEAVFNSTKFDLNDEVLMRFDDYFDKRDSFTTYFNSITEQCNYSEAKKICDNISSVIDDYWTLSDEIIRQGATSDVNASNNAQRLEMNKLTPEYDTIYEAAHGLLCYQRQCI